jgi:hypothetical protein
MTGSFGDDARPLRGEFCEVVDPLDISPPAYLRHYVILRAVLPSSRTAPAKPDDAALYTQAPRPQFCSDAG